LNESQFLGKVNPTITWRKVHGVLEDKSDNISETRKDRGKVAKKGL